jgi:hypothetical protein
MHKLTVLVGILVFVTAGTRSFAQEAEAEVNAEASVAVAADTAETAAPTVEAAAPVEEAAGATPPPAEEAAAEGEVSPAGGMMPSDEDEEIVIPPLTWLLTVGVLAARLKNTTKFEFEMPEEGQDDPEAQSITVTDKGWGLALNIVGFYRWITIASVNWFFPKINNAVNFGGVLQVVGQIPTGTIVRPTIGIGLFYQLVHVDWEPFRTPSEGKNDSIRTFGGGDFEHMTVHVTSLTPLPEIGLFIKLPLYNWWIKPYYSYWHTFNSGYAKNTGGRVDVFRNANEGFHDMYQVDDPNMVVGGPSDPAKLQFNETFDSTIQSHIVGASFNIDWNYVVSVMGMYNVNVTRNLHSIRLIFTMFFNRYVGVAAVFDYQELTTVKNIAGYFGPCFLFMTKGFMDAVDKKREKATRDKEKAKDAERQAQAAAEGGDDGEWGDDSDWGDEPDAEEAPAAPEAPAEEAGPAATAPAE